MNIPYSYIAIEGLICTGKTHLTTLLANKFDATPIYEEFENNPFLKQFYDNPKNNALPTQLFFLISRYHQLSSLKQTDLFESIRIADYIFDKNKIFSSVILNENELSLYYKVNNLLVDDVPKPDLIIYLQADINYLLERISNRGIEYEETISMEYLKSLSEAYNQYFFTLKNDTPVLTINITNLDFQDTSNDFLWLLDELQKPIHGKKFLNPQKGFN